MDLGHWKISSTLSSQQEIPENVIGFVYCITNSLNSKKYIGKKLLINKKRRKPLKGRKNDRLYTKNSNWKVYCGSCKELLNDIQNLGESNFNFEILYWCKSKWDLSYMELREQINREVLFKNDYYNSYIGCRLKKLIKN